MSYLNVYIGIYLEIPILKVERKTTVKIDSRGKVSAGKFDSYTGELLKEVEKIETQIVYPTTEIDDDKFFEKYNVAPEYLFDDVPLTSDKHLSLFMLDDNNSKYYSRHDVDGVKINAFENVEKIISDFKEEYKNYLDYYKSEGYDITVKFGVITYAY
jgi:hypothetical protein